MVRIILAWHTIARNKKSASRKRLAENALPVFTGRA